MSENTTVMVDSSTIVSPLEKNKVYNQYLDELNQLRKDGENKIIALADENKDARLNKQMAKEDKQALFEKNKALKEEAVKVKNENKEKVKEISTKAIKEYSTEWKEYYAQVCEAEKQIIISAKEDYRRELEEIKAEYKGKVDEIKSRKGELSPEDYKRDLKDAKISFSSKKENIKNKKVDTISNAKDRRYNAYLEKYTYSSKCRNNHHSIDETLEYKGRSYAYNFNTKNFLLKNGLYIVILIIFLVFIIVSNGSLITWNSIIGILGQSSYKVFYSLGVAGLILLAGTDLSIGRLTGVGATLAAIFCGDLIVNDALFGITIDPTGMGVAGKVILGILASVVVCVIFTSIAGFFSAKFKMHPFITTLSTQLVSYGLFMMMFGSYPGFDMNRDLKNAIRGDNNVNLIIFAIIAIVIVWFIWNKTKFGKNMFAVGGNAEAASVSGISVFWTTMFVFIMAGVLYGFGGFFTAAAGSANNPNTGFGTELDAIAACVVGGISFSGGIGKISGAVVGTIIFSGMTYCLANVGVDTNITFIFKGLIIMAAVCLDSLKYLKKK